jgi:hypothetical protein
MSMPIAMHDGTFLQTDYTPNKDSPCEVYFRREQAKREKAVKDYNASLNAIYAFMQHRNEDF